MTQTTSSPNSWVAFNQAALTVTINTNVTGAGARAFYIIVRNTDTGGISRYDTTPI